METTAVQPSPSRSTTEQPLSSRPASIEVVGPISPYRPSNTVPFEGLLMLIVFTLIGGLLLGSAAFVVSQVVYLIILFPLGVGFGCGAIIATAVKWEKVRSPRIAGLFGLAIGLLVYGRYWVWEYQMFRSELDYTVRLDMLANFGEFDPERVDESVDLIMVNEVGHGGFLGYVLIRAREGVPIGQAVSSTSLKLGETLAWLYWLIEAGIILGVAAFFAAGKARLPFCETHERWYRPPKAVGRVNPGQAKKAITLLQAGKMAELRQLLATTPFTPAVEFTIRKCNDCQASNPVITVSVLPRIFKGKIKTKQLLAQTISPAQGEMLLM